MIRPRRFYQRKNFDGSLLSVTKSVFHLQNRGFASFTKGEVLSHLKSEILSHLKSAVLSHLKSVILSHLKSAVLSHLKSVILYCSSKNLVIQSSYGSIYENAQIFEFFDRIEETERK